MISPRRRNWGPRSCIGATNEHPPASVKGHLPPAAQDIFGEAFNRAFERYDEATAFRVAWAAVKRRYAKVDGEWVRKV